MAKNLKSVIEKAIADAFSSGAQWKAIKDGADSATMRPKQWVDDHEYQALLKERQRETVDAVARAVMRMALPRGDRE